MKERIAFVVHRYGKEVNGGAELHCRMIAERMKDIYDVEVLTSCSMGINPWDNEYPAGEQDLNGVTVRRFPVIDGSMYPNRSIEKIGPFTPDLIDYLQENHKKYKGIILITFNYYPTYMGLRLNLDNTIFLPTVHDGPTIRWDLYQCIFDNPRGILYNSQEEKDFILDYFKTMHIPSRLTCYGMDVPERKEKKTECEENYIIYAGRVSGSKNFGELNDYFLRYKKEHPSDLKLVVVGKIDNNMTIKHHDDIIFKGFVSDEEKEAYIENAKLLVLPSKNESLSIVLLESMSYGKPVLVNGQCAVLKGQCKRSNAGLYYTNYDEFEAELDYMLSHPDVCEEMGENGYRFVKEGYSWEGVINNIVSLIDEIHV